MEIARKTEDILQTLIGLEYILSVDSEENVIKIKEANGVEILQSIQTNESYASSVHELAEKLIMKYFVTE